jgi:hypothetical protein
MSRPPLRRVLLHVSPGCHRAGLDQFSRNASDLHGNADSPNQTFKCADTTDVVRVDAGDILSISTFSSISPVELGTVVMNVSVEKQ